MVRHGESKSNIEKIFSCRNEDYPLTRRGILQVRQTAEYFKDKTIDEIYCSPLKRAMETAEVIAGRLGLKFSVMENFREIDVGSLEGPSTREALEIFGRIINDWRQGKHDSIFPEGENYSMLAARMKQGIERIIKEKDNKSIIIIGHGGIFNETIMQLCQNIDVDYLYNTENYNCSISTIKFCNKNGIIAGVLEEWASCSHLCGKAAEFADW